MKKNRGSRGAVSVFLVIVLVPCIVVSSVFVDLGRVNMSKSMAASASDLALNSLMANYDADLSEWYGMAASCQNIQEFYEGSAQFFLRTLSSQGLSDDEIILLSDYYASATSDDTIYDFLKMESQTAPSEMINAVDDANLSNATLLKDQVVEFMKYRGPIEMTAGIIKRFEDAKTSGELTNVLESDKNNDLIDDKTEFFEAEGEFLEAALNSYIAIYDYYDAARASGLSNDKLTGYVDKLTDYKDVYFEIHKWYVSNLCNTGGLGEYRRVTKSLPYGTSAAYICSRSETVDDVTTYYINATKINNLLSTLNTKIAAFNTAKNNLANDPDIISLMNNQPGTGATQANVMQWWVRMNSEVSSHTSNINTKANEMMSAFANVLGITNCVLEEGTGESWRSTRENYLTQVRNLQSTCLTYGTTSTTDNYIKAVKKLEDISSAYIGQKNAVNLYVTVDGSSKNLEGALSYIQAQLSAMRTELQGYVDLLNIAIDGGGDVKSLDTLLTLANTYDAKLDDWYNTADNIGTDMGDKDKEDIADIRNGTAEGAATGAELKSKINGTAVTQLKTRLTNIRSQLNAVISGIDSLKYGNTQLRVLSTYSTFSSKAATKVSASSIGLTNQEIANYATTTFGQLFVPTSNPVMTLSHTTDANYNPQIDPATGEVSTPDLFKFLHLKFKDTSKQVVEDEKTKLSNGKDAGTDKATAAKDKGRYNGGGTDIARDFSGDQTFSLTGVFADAVEVINKLANNNLAGIRDDLYVTCYMMEMFSYATYENEGLYGLVENKTDLTLSNKDTKYQEVMGTVGADDNEGKWLSEAYTDPYNKSLTNQLINKNNNAAYCAEVEYILYGGRAGEGNDSNVKAVYNNIYGIRYPLNLVSGFANFWKTPMSPNDNPNAFYIGWIANSIQSLTSGIIPAPLTKVVLIPILTIFETSKDLDRLEAGFPVELYKKTDEEWWIKIPSASDVSGFTNALSGLFDGPNQGNGLYYSDYLTIFVYLGLNSDAAEDMYQRMAEVIQANIRKLSGESTYSMKKAQVYFKHEATIRVEPLMITMPIFNGFDNNMDTKTDWCTYKISTVRGYS